MVLEIIVVFAQQHDLSADCVVENFRLGVQLEMRDKNVAIAAVTPSGLAEQSGIRAGDVVVSVAGAPVSSMASVIAAVREQPAGTWLPIQIRRGDSTIDLVIKFPPKT